MIHKEFEKDEGEEILLRSNFHPSLFYGGVGFSTYVAATTVAAGTTNTMSYIFIPIGLIWLAAGFLKWTYKEYILTNNRLAIVSGYFYLRTESIPLDEIEHVSLYQNWTDRWWGKGIVTLFGMGIQTKRLKGIKTAKEFKDAIHSQLSVDPEPYFPG